MKMLLLLISTLTAFTLIFTAIHGCGKDDKADDAQKTPEVAPDEPVTPETGSLSVSISEDSISSIPMYQGQNLVATGHGDATAQTGTLAVSSSLQMLSTQVSNFNLGVFFKMECHGDDPATIADSICPESLKKKLATMNSEQLKTSGFKMSLGSFIGQIEHAEIYLKTAYPQEETALTYETTPTTTKIKEGESITFVSETSTKDTPDATGDASKYLIDVPNFYDRLTVEKPSSGPSAYIAFRNPDDDGRFGMTFSIKNGDESSSTKTGSGCDLLQVYLTVNPDTEKGRVMAFNSIAFTDYVDTPSTTDDDFVSQRAIVIVNFETNKSIVKYKPGGGSNGEIVAIGSAGMNMTSGAQLDGYYYAKAAGMQNTDPYYQKCINNNGHIEVADSFCATEKTLFDAGDFDVKGFLDLTDQEAIDLAGYIAILKTGDILTSQDVPSSETDLKNIPDRFEIK